jgi:hypothetical protein
MSAVIDGEVWAIDSVPLYFNPGVEQQSNDAQFFRVKGIFIYNSINSSLPNNSDVVIPKCVFTNIEGHIEGWIVRNKKRIVDSALPIVRCVNNKWIIDLTLVNNVYDTATLIV